MKPCLNQNTLRTTPTEAFLEVARRAEFDAIELTMGEVEPIIEKGAITQLKKKIEDNGLTVASINGPEKFNLLTEEEFGTLLSRTKKVAMASIEIGCTLLVPVPSPFKDHASVDTVVTQATQSLNGLTEVCGSDICLGLEFLGEERCSINTLNAAVKVINSVAKHNVGLVVDSFHMHLSKTALSELAHIQSNRLFLVHVNDSEAGDPRKLTDANRLLPGDGVMKLQDLKQSLVRIGYDGFLSLELFKPSYWQQDPQQVAKICRESLKHVFEV